MVNFLLKNSREYNLSIVNNVVYGEVGFSFTSKSVTHLITSINGYLIEEGIDRVCIAYDSSPWAERFATSVVVNRLKELGLFCSLPDTPIPTFQLSWLTTQSKKRSIGIYLGSDSHTGKILEIRFYQPDGSPFEERDLRKILKGTCKIKLLKEKDILAEESETVDLSGYVNYLIDRNLINALPEEVKVNLDLMVGASESCIDNLSGGTNLVIKKFNSPKSPPRLKNYRSKPTDSFLKWYTTYPDRYLSNYFMAIDGDGDSLGVYDLKQNSEIGPSSIAMLLLKHLKEIKGVKGGYVLLSSALSDRVAKYARKLGYKVKYSDNGIQDLVKIAKKTPIVFYADESGGYHFKGDLLNTNPAIALCRIVEICEIFHKSPGEIVDYINLTLKIKLVAASLIFLKEIASKNGLINFVKTTDKLPEIRRERKGKIHSFFFKNKMKIDIKENEIEETVEVFIECQTSTDALETSYLIQKYTD